MEHPKLSKSRFVAGLQCPLRLWNQCYRAELAAEPSPAQQALFDTGHEVGRLATRLYPGGALIEEDHLHHEEAVRSTLQALATHSLSALYEAAFLTDGIRVRADILERLPQGRWNLIEVKSATSVKDVYIPDVALQYHVLQAAGLDVARAGILHLNTRYFFDGCKLDLTRLFHFADLTGDVVVYQEQLGARLAEFRTMLARSEPPEIEPGRQCVTPYTCEFRQHCTREKPRFWVFTLPGLTEKKYAQLRAAGIEDIRDIPAGFRLTAMQARVARCIQEEREYLGPELTGVLHDVEYPVHFLDFETIAPAIPRYAGTRSYQAVPFQWSDHVLARDGTLEHHEFLHDQETDPRPVFYASLLEALGDRGSIFIYTGYELGVMKGLASALPSHGLRFAAIADRCKDLHAAIRSHYYHPDFGGSFSLKAVLPSVVPEMGYGGLAVQQGNQASLEYLRMIDPSTPDPERKGLRSDLLAYCRHDTLAMVRLREELLRRAS